MYLKVRSGVVTESNISITSHAKTASAEARKFDQVLKDKSIQDIKDFNIVLGEQADHVSSSDISGISRWLNTVFGKSG